MNDGIPVTIHLSRPTFLALEKIAAQRGVGMRRLIEAYLDRSLQKRERRDPKRRSAGAIKPGNKQPYVTLTVEQQGELVELTRLGWSLSELAERYGCSTNTVNNWRRRLGVQHRRKEDL
jgi:DNA-binding NarL/FixJ family response regulator